MRLTQSLHNMDLMTTAGQILMSLQESAVSIFKQYFSDVFTFCSHNISLWFLNF